jgi:predicted RNA-binding protein with RPS1 domain
VRYSFLEHEELLALNSNKNFEIAKEYVIEGLSVKLESTLKVPPKTPGVTQISTVMRNHMKQAKEILNKVGDKLEVKVEGQEMKNALGDNLKKILKQPDGTNLPNPYL